MQQRSKSTIIFLLSCLIDFDLQLLITQGKCQYLDAALKMQEAGACTAQGPPERIADISPHYFSSAQPVLEDRQAGSSAQPVHNKAEQPSHTSDLHWNVTSSEVKGRKRLRDDTALHETKNEAACLIDSLGASDARQLGALQGSDESILSLQLQSSPRTLNSVPQQKRRRSCSSITTLQEEPEGKLWSLASPVVEDCLEDLGCKEAAMPGGGALHVAVVGF